MWEGIMLSILCQQASWPHCIPVSSSVTWRGAGLGHEAQEKGRDNQSSASVVSLSCHMHVSLRPPSVCGGTMTALPMLTSLPSHLVGETQCLEPGHL